jgi:hypothetical protein
MSKVLPTVALGVLTAFSACAPAIRPTVPHPPTGRELAEFWEEPGKDRLDLIHGPGGRKLLPPADSVFRYEARDNRGYSVSYDVKDQKDLEWSVKVGDEAQSEVAASRIVWALGYRQPPIYLLPRWTLREGDRESVMSPGRFRPKKPVLETAGVWSWYQNPYVDTPAYKGLLVVMLLLNSTDLKDDNNAVYEQTILPAEPRRWYVVKDLGATFGTTGRLYPARNDIEKFESHGFIKGVEAGRVRFHYRGRHQKLFDNVHPRDVRWACERAARLTDEQFGGAFRAASYDPQLAERFTRALRQRIAEGLALGEATQ